MSPPPAAGDLPTALLPLDEIVVGERIRQDMGDLAALAASITEQGLLNPLTVDGDYRLLAGGRRLAALRALNVERVSVRVAVSANDALTAARIERDENTCRKDFTPEEAVRAGLLVEELERPKAEERKAEGQQRGRATQGCPVGGKLPPSDPARPPRAKTRDTAAAAVRMGARTYEKAKAVVEAAEDETLPAAARAEAADALEQMNRTGKVDPAFKRVQKAIEPPPPQDDAEMQRLKLRAAVARGVCRASAFHSEFRPELVASSIDTEDEWDSYERVRRSMNDWFDQLKALRPGPGLRLMGGGQ